ncbi:hypothetical protein CBR_g16816 [Chara braunii]|uniref:Integrase catalytic domain-containing protein n=1 Tax=Chara braunii TaxID=69332 RepID=A0A388KTT6_CHABU|nr:hypothetical protein CBR_g16816 [Chara braunii]|eukprot:GBG73475.1 hypothetical protein CBR_g16816 [Chara braunii]
MSDREEQQPDDRILRSARRPLAHLALGPEGDKYLFRQRRESLQQQQRGRDAEVSRAFASEAAASVAMASAAQQSSQAGSSGTVGSTAAQTQSKSAGVMASQSNVLSPEEIAIQQAALQEAQLQKALGDTKAEKERMIRRVARMQRREADVRQLEEMDLTNMNVDVRGRVHRLSRPVESTCAKKQRMVVNDYLQDVECLFPHAGGELRHRVSFLVSDELPMDMLSDRCEAAFRQLKHALTHYEVLKLPDPDKSFVVTTDANQYGIDAVLAQQEGKTLRPVEYMSKKMPSQKLAKSTYEKELYAIYKALTHWRQYLLGRFFYARTDHQTPRWMKTQSVLSDALKHWIEVIEQYDFEPQYIKSEYNKVADALSRRPDFLGALVTEFGLADDVTQSLVEAYREDPFMAEIIRRLEAKDKETSAEFELVNGLLFLEKAGNKRLCVCQRDKPRAQAPLGLVKPLPVPERPGESLSMDFMDTLVTSKSGMLYIYVLVDRFSKFARLVAMPATAKTEYVITMFKENWIRDFGLPKSIVSDRDVRFTSELWKAAAAEQGTQLQMTSGNHPEANGQAEQMNRAVQHLLRHYIKPNQVDWDEKLALITSLYNNVVHSATGASPNSLLLTFRPGLPLDFLLPDNQPTAAPGTLEFVYRYEHLMQQAVEQMHKAQAAMIESENKHRRPSTFQVGERVWVKSSELEQEYGISRKLVPQYFGPWEVFDVVGNEPDGPSYVIRIPGHLRTYPVFHASKLAPFKETDQFPSRRSMLPPTMDGEVDIDDIVDHRELPVPRPTGRGRPPKPKLQYRVRFRHHLDPKEDRWFTREELMQNAPQIVAQYEKSLQKGKLQIIED